MKRATKAKGTQRPAAWTGADLKLHLTCAEAMIRLRAFNVDANPQHVIDAFRLFRCRGLQVPPNMLRILDRVLDDLKKKPSGNAARNTVRDVRVIQEVLVLADSDNLPSRVDAKLIASIAKTYRMTVPAVKQVIHRFRRIERDPGYNAPRAFRKGKA